MYLSKVEGLVILSYTWEGWFRCLVSVLKRDLRKTKAKNKKEARFTQWLFLTGI